MGWFLLFLLTSFFGFEHPKLVNACLASRSPSTPVVTTEAPTVPPTEAPTTEAPTTEAPTVAPEIRTCSASTITFGMGDTNNPQQQVDVTNFGLTSTQIAGTQDSISTMKITCMAIDGYYVNMDFNDGGQVKENLDEIQNITIEVTCDSRTMEWIYSSVLDNGDVYTHTVTSANCLQNEEVPLNACSPTAITYLRDDPDFYVEVTDFGFTSTRIPDTTETISTMKISCMATDGNYVNMDFNEGYQAEDNLNMVQNITITVTCDSRNMNWIYTGPDPDTGGTIDFTVTTVECPQLPL